MALTVGAARRPANRGRTLDLAPRRLALTLRKPGGQGGLELRAGGHAELAVGGGEVRLDGLDAEEQLARDRAVAAPRRRQRGDLAVGGGRGGGARAPSVAARRGRSPVATSSRRARSARGAAPAASAAASSGPS